MNFYGGEIRHHPTCAFYPESLTQMYDALRARAEQLERERDEARAMAKLDAAHFKFKFRQQTRCNERQASRANRHLHSALKLTEERDRYKRALEEIAQVKLFGCPACQAKAALAGVPDGSTASPLAPGVDGRGG